MTRKVTLKLDHKTLVLRSMRFILQYSLVDRIMAFKDVYFQISRSCKHVTLHGKRGFEDVIIFTDFEILDYPMCPNLII